MTPRFILGFPASSHKTPARQMRDGGCRATEWDDGHDPLRGLQPVVSLPPRQPPCAEDSPHRKGSQTRKSLLHFLRKTPVFIPSHTSSYLRVLPDQAASPQSSSCHFQARSPPPVKGDPFPLAHLRKPRPRALPLPSARGKAPRPPPGRCQGPWAGGRRGGRRLPGPRSARPRPPPLHPPGPGPALPSPAAAVRGVTALRGPT